LSYNVFNGKDNDWHRTLSTVTDETKYRQDIRCEFVQLADGAFPLEVFDNATKTATRIKGTRCERGGGGARLRGVRHSALPRIHSTETH